MSADRIAALKALIAYELPVEPTLAKLALFRWGCEQPLIALTHKDVVCILQRHMVGALSAEQLTDWADLIECREDIELASEPPDISAAISRLANPALYGPVTRTLVAELSAAFGTAV